MHLVLVLNWIGVLYPVLRFQLDSFKKVVKALNINRLNKQHFSKWLIIKSKYVLVFRFSFQSCLSAGGDVLMLDWKGSRWIKRNKREWINKLREWRKERREWILEPFSRQRLFRFTMLELFFDLFNLQTIKQMHTETFFLHWYSIKTHVIRLTF